MPLIIAPLNQPVKVLKILADDKTKKHLESLGITINSLLTVVQNSSSIVVKVKDGRLALDAGLATKIVVA
jgi:ferrous iron transport protein A